MAITVDSTADPSDFINHSEKNPTPANDAGRVPKLESSGKLHPFFLDPYTEITAGDDFTAPVPVFINQAAFERQVDADTVSQLSSDTDFNLAAATNTILAQLITIPAAPTVDGLAFDFVEVVSVVWNGRWTSAGGVTPGASSKFQGVSSGEPDGVDEVAWTSGTDWGSSNGASTVTFASPVTVTAGNQYAFLCRNKSADRTAAVRYNSAGGYAGGNALTSTDSGANWTTLSSADAHITVNLNYYYNTIPGYVYPTDANGANAEEYNNFIGFVGSDVSVTGNAKVYSYGVLGGFSGLTPGDVYYLSDTQGQISASPGSNSVTVGRAISSTSLLIQVP